METIRIRNNQRKVLAWLFLPTGWKIWNEKNASFEMSSPCQLWSSAESNCKIHFGNGMCKVYSETSTKIVVQHTLHACIANIIKRSTLGLDFRHVQAQKEKLDIAWGIAHRQIMLCIEQTSYWITVACELPVRILIKHNNQQSKSHQLINCQL